MPFSHYLKAGPESLRKYPSWYFPPFTFAAPALKLPDMSVMPSELLALFIPSQACIFKYALLSPQNISAGLPLLPFCLSVFWSPLEISLKMIFSIKEPLINSLLGSLDYHITLEKPSKSGVLPVRACKQAFVCCWWLFIYQHLLFLKIIRLLR